MKIILREIINSDMREVCTASFTPSQPDDVEKIAREAFDFVLINYIIKQFPNGCGVRTERRILPNGNIDLYCHCSGRNVRYTGEHNATHISNDFVQNDREYQLSILKI